MIDEIYNSRIGAIKTDHFSDEWEQTAIPFEESLTEEQTILYHAPYYWQALKIRFPQYTK